MSVEQWKSIFDWSSIFLVALTVFTGGGALITGGILNKRQSTQIKQLDSDLARAQKDAADANTKLAEFKHASMPRDFDPATIAKKIGQFAGVNAAIFALSEFEPSRTSALINVALTDAKWTIHGSGWAAGSPDELSRPGVWIEVSPMAEPIRTHREGIGVDATTGRAIRYEIPPDPKIPEREQKRELARLNAAAIALRDALCMSGVDAGIRPLSKSFLPFPPPPSDSIVIFVGLKPLPGMPSDLRVAQPPG